jgi:putative oxidoreductase
MLSVLRVVTAALYFEHGLQKVFNLPPIAGAPVPYYVASLNGAAGLIETVGGFALLLGLFTRPVAFLAAGEMAVAYFKVHIERSAFPINNRGDNVVLFCFIFLYLMVAGAGPWSIDAILDRSRRRSASRGGQ